MGTCAFAATRLRVSNFDQTRAVKRPKVFVDKQDRLLRVLMKRLDRLEVTLPIQNDEIKRRSRLVLLVYDVLRDMATPAEEATNAEVFSALSQAFLDKATAQGNCEAAAPRESRKLSMFSRPTS